MKVEFDKLIIERIVLELRFSGGYLYWDNCGKIWRDIFKKWEDFEMKQVSPEKAVFRMKNEDLELSFNDKTIIINQNYPRSSLKTFIEIAEKAIPIILGFLDIKTLSRIGNRIFYLFPTTDIKEATDIVKNTGLLNIPEEKINLFGDTFEEPRVQFHIKTEDIGYRFNIQAVSRKLTMEVPQPIKIDDSLFIDNFVLFDIDYYTLKEVDLSISDFKALIKQVQKNLSTNLHKLISQE